MARTKPFQWVPGKNDKEYIKRLLHQLELDQFVLKEAKMKIRRQQEVIDALMSEKEDRVTEETGVVFTM